MAEREGRRDPTGTIGRNLEAFLLMQLQQGPSYGRDLIRRLDGYGFRRVTGEPGVVYKMLRALEDSGDIHSTWATRESGPARRYYEMTEQGSALLDRRMHQLFRYQGRISQLLSEYREVTGKDPGAGEEDDHPRALVAAGVADSVGSAS